MAIQLNYEELTRVFMGESYKKHKWRVWNYGFQSLPEVASIQIYASISFYQTIILYYDARTY